MSTNFSLIFLVLYSLSSRALAQGVKQKDPPVRESYLKDPAFAKLILKTVKNRKDLDLGCKASHGPYHYYSYTGNCESCSKLCTNPTPGMKKECFDHCNDFMINLEIEKTFDSQHLKITNLQLENSQLKESITENQVYWKNVINTNAVVFAVTIVVVVIIFSCIAILQFVYNRNKYALRPPTQENPIGDKELNKLVQPSDSRSEAECDSFYGSMVV